MAQTTGNITVGYEGSVYVAPTGTAAPTAEDSTLNAAFKEVGYLADNGITIAHNDDTTELKAWQRSTVVRKTITQSDTTVQFAMVESRNKAAVELFYKKAMEVGADSLLEGGALAATVSVVIDVIDGTKVHRMYLPSCEVTGRGDIQITSQELERYDVTLTAYEVAGVKITHFWDAALT